MNIREATTSHDIASVLVLFKEYAATLPFDLEFQHFTEELATLPGQYAAPTGVLLLARENKEPLGCVAIRPIKYPEIGELKRLYVRPQHRGHHLGLHLCTFAIERARSAGYKRIRLDTLPDMREARRLYKSLGFYKIPAYCFSPVQDAIFMELSL
jgi:ribosomal protein S18 acetylase RimI-like enzyme